MTSFIPNLIRSLSNYRVFLLIFFVAMLSSCFSDGNDSNNGDGGGDQVIEPIEPPVEPLSENTVVIYEKEWRQPADFTGYIFQQVSDVCPAPAGVCSGSLQGSTFDLTGYTWASIDEISAMFNAYGLDPPFTGPFQERSGDKQAYIAISQDFTPTANVCYGDCPVDFDEVAGMVRDSAELGEQPYQALFRYIAPGWSPSGESVYFNNTGYTAPTPSDQVGVWFWRQAGLGTLTVDGREWAQVDQFTNLSWNQINAVCPEGVCAGLLNGHDMTGWAWASVDDINALFNYYIGSDELGPGPDYLSDANSANSVWGPAFFRDGWRVTYSYPNVLRITQGWVSGVLGLGDGYLSYLVDVEDEGGWINDELDTRKTPLISDDVGGWFYRIP